MEKFLMDSKKSMNLLEIKKDMLPDYLFNNYFVNQSVNNVWYYYYAKWHF